MRDPICTRKRAILSPTLIQATNYAGKCLNACRVLARLFARALGVDPDFFDRPGYFDNPTCLLGMNFYHFR